ncbi:MAG: DUF3280 domain-containing protein [Geminicoccaceae bacterium]
MPQARASGNRRLVPVVVATALVALAAHPARAAAAEPVRIAVFDLELDDRSAGGGVLGPDARDADYLRQTTEEARRLLAASGRYTVVYTDSVAGEIAAAGGIRHCNGCDGPLALKLGAAQAMIGVLTRVSRTEYTLQLVVRDARTGAVVSDNFSGLRMGANYSWPRGVKWLVTNRILPSTPVE